MVKGLQRSLSRAPVGRGTAAPRLPITRRFELTGATFTVDGATGVGFGSFDAGAFPEGNLSILSALVNVSFAGSGSDAGLGDTWAGDFGVGTTPASDGTISVGDEDIIVETALAAATAEVSPTSRVANATPAIIDNTEGDLELNVNLLIDDADISADGVIITMTGFVEVVYTVLGDD